MIPYYISQDCVAALLEGDETRNIRKNVASCLVAAGFRPWQDVEAEIYDLNGRSLLIARPRSPVRDRLIGSFPRLCRIK